MLGVVGGVWGGGGVLGGGGGVGGGGGGLWKTGVPLAVSSLGEGEGLVEKKDCGRSGVNG